MVDQLGLGVGAALHVHADLARDPRADLGCVGDVLERNELRAVREQGSELGERAQREPRLADAAGTDQVHQPAVVAREQFADPLQLDRAADEVAVRRRGRACRGADGGDARRAQGLVERLQPGARREAQLGRQAAGERLVGLARAGALSRAREPSHVRTQRGLVERIGFEQPRRQFDAFRGVEVAVEPRERRGAPRRAQPVALEAEPALPRLGGGVVEAREQLAGHERERLGRALSGERRLEVGDVRRGDDAHGAALRFHQAAPRHRLQPEQRLAEVRVGQLVGLLGPERRREFRPAHPGALQREQDQQLAAPLGRQHEGLAVERDLRSAEELQPDRHRKLGSEL